MKVTFTARTYNIRDERYNLFENKLTYCDIYILISGSIKVIYIKLLYIKILVIRYLKKKKIFVRHYPFSRIILILIMTQ